MNLVNLCSAPHFALANVQPSYALLPEAAGNPRFEHFMLPSTTIQQPSTIQAESVSNEDEIGARKFLDPSLIQPSTETILKFQEVEPEDRLADDEKARVDMCWGCGTLILDKFMLKIEEHSLWHEHCLKCRVCEELLVEKCFFRSGQVYCRDDYCKLFATKCAQCTVALRAEDYVLRSENFVFHVDCFRCLYCNQQLRKDDRYYCEEGVIICQRDYSLINLQRHLNEANLGISDEHSFLGGQFLPTHQTQIEFALHHSGHSHHNLKKMPKRPRTILNAPQRKAFKTAFEKGPKPSRKAREQLAKETGLSVRVVQVWFQNQRAKIKKDQRKRENALMNNEKTESVASGTTRLSGYSTSDSARCSQSECSGKTTPNSDSDDSMDESGIKCQGLTEPTPLIRYATQKYADYEQINELNPIEKLRHMNQTYFSTIA